MNRTFKFHEFISKVEDNFLGKELDSITMLITDSDGRMAKAHMSVQFMPKAKSEAEDQEFTMAAMVTHIFPQLWDLFADATPRNKELMKGGIKILLTSMEIGKLELPKCNH